MGEKVSVRIKWDKETCRGEKLEGEKRAVGKSESTQRIKKGLS